MGIRLAEAGLQAIEMFSVGELSLPRLVLSLEHVVDEAEGDVDPHAGALRRLWIDLEMINAMHEGKELSQTTRASLDDMLCQLCAVLREVAHD